MAELAEREQADPGKHDAKSKGDYLAEAHSPTIGRGCTQRKHRAMAWSTIELDPRTS